MKEQLALLPGLLAAHLGLSLVALALGIVVSVPLGVVVSRSPRLAPPIVGAASVLQTIPSLALLAFMVPALAALGARSIGYLPALIGLVLYSLLPILRNTVAGLSGLDPAVLEAAKGVGMTPRQSLFRVELPLAMPVIVAGIRISAVWTVGTATLSTPVGAPSLGNYIFGGLQTRNYTSVLVGCVASAVLALVIDGLLRGVHVGLSQRRRGALAVSLVGFLLLAAYGAAPFVRAAASREEAPVTIGAKTFTESYILAEILAAEVQRRTGSPTRTVGSLGSTVAFDALRTGQIDAYVDYSGTLWATVLGRGEAPADRETVRAEVERLLPERYGVHVVAALGFENTYTLAMRRAEAERLGLRRIGDLAPLARRLRVGGDYEFFLRPEWKNISRVYGLVFAEERSMDSSLMYEAAKNGAVDVIGAFSTDGRIAAYDLVVLEDDRHAIPPYDALVLASDHLVRERPEVIDALRALAGRIDEGTMRRLNREVDQEKQTPAAVAGAFLERLR
ncbi:ABC transporter permease/substrate-binding protein [Polyangium spumosum]|uniref:ABC transporter permease subunit n=1 Tax=Polyangium spumosum TaxID=889282 RepID=A0A6N7PIN7_9BACT|nr:ABC transporter permease/substrate-binding protein [Polyangium spumosum]MRG91848.1 ABC transporter permease subunit [Polyangium spumosum]